MTHPQGRSGLPRMDGLLRKWYPTLPAFLELHLEAAAGKPSPQEEIRKPTKACPALLVFIQVLTLQFLIPLWAHGVGRPQEQQKTSLGSLSTFGEVYVDDTMAPLETTIFSGDVLRTGGAGTAVFTLSGKGSFRISPDTQIVFTGNPQYIAELKAGSVVMSSLSGATGINLRAGNSVVVAVTEGEQSSSNIQASSDGSFFVSCMDGSVGIIPLQGGSGLFIQAGQSASISPNQSVTPESKPPTANPAPAPPSTTTPPATQRKKSNTRWIILGAAAAAGVGGITGIASHGGGKPISPAAP
jgi:hypothetical protein